MPRIRQVKPDFWEDTDIAELSLGARLLYIGLWCFMDCKGVCEASARLIKRNIFPYDEDITLAKLSDLIEELVGNFFLFRVEYAGKSYLYCPTLEKHQKFHPKEQIKFDVPLDLLRATCQPVAGNCSAVSMQVASRVDNGELRMDNEEPDSRPEFDFERLYKKYPKKAGKVDGLRECQKQIVEPSSA